MRQFLALALTFCALPALASPELKGSPDELRQFLHPSENQVMLYAEAEETAYSDIAVIDLVVRTEAKNLADSLQANTRIRETITKTLIAEGIAPDAIKNAKFATSPQFGWFGDTPKSYEVLNRITIKVSDEAHMQRIATLADKHKEVEFGGTRFEHSEKEKFEAKVKKDALAKLMQQKLEYEQALGLDLQPISFRKASVEMAPTAGAMALEEIVVTASRSKRADSYLSDSREPAPAATPSFDEIRYHAGIYVEFRVQKPK
ncbi:SIMPL domain-containing protein [Simiduia agarivorans]|uniref:Secreted protein n=1 Tax=Simiduia agarivorans (strain DSM 21679 / JCM 13881 / BCRC 17597 / SA1) TaxID=1117647 RepID=K4KJP5_SIMAS|nr:SIMPL domain-containing protein [Simiduia agarivorans]AFU98223.1 secreted protein [Simiduia agarivorans SA1 = DSM 21679]